MAIALVLVCGTVSTVSGQEPTISWLDVQPNPVVLGDQVTIIAVVQTEGAWPEGTFSISDDSLLLAETELEEGGSCGRLVEPSGNEVRFCTRHSSLTTSTLAAGTHPLTASYSGDAETLPSTSDPVILTVQQPPAQVPALGPAAALTLALLLTLAGCALLKRQRDQL